MNIQRQYSLPNCKLILEGLSNEAAETVARPLVSAVTTVECYFSGYEKPLTGGRDFLESLVSAVSDYVQAYLSGIPHPVAHRDRQNHHRLVELERVDKNLHRLMIQPQISNGVPLSTTPQQFDLTTVQLFDLVEAVDQFYADAQTLPDLALHLSPLPRRYAIAQQPIAKRAAAPALGVSGLAVAALALFFIPAPPVQRPQPTSTSTESASPTSANASASASPPGASSPDPGASLGEEQSAILDTAQEITDPAEQERLKASLYDKIDQTWKTTPTFTKALEYRVGINGSGEVVGYKFVNPEALQYKQEVPLLELLRVPGSGEPGEASPSPEAIPPEAIPPGAISSEASPDSAEAGNQGAIAQFLVVFRPNGVLEVSPWYGQSSTGETPASPSPSP